MIVGNVGLGINNNMTVMVLPVNIASRLQMASKKLNNSFIVSDEVVNLLNDLVTAPVETIRLKGVKTEHIVHLLGKSYSDIIE